MTHSVELCCFILKLLVSSQLTILFLRLQSLDALLRHPEDNRNQIRELAQTLMDGGVLDELIQQKLDAFNTRWDELFARVGHTAQLKNRITPAS